MPRDGFGVASPPPNTRGGPANTPISSTKYNSVVDDVYQIFNDPTPVTAGGTGGSSVATAQAGLSVDSKAVYVAKAAGYTAVATDNNALHRCTATLTLGLTAAATLGNGWHLLVTADGGDVTIDPNSTETINGASTIIVHNGQSVFIYCSGTAFYATGLPLVFWGNVTINGTLTVTG